MDRPDAWNGLVLFPVHLDNCDNYWIRHWERDREDHVVWGGSQRPREPDPGHAPTLSPTEEAVVRLSGRRVPGQLAQVLLEWRAHFRPCGP